MARLISNVIDFFQFLKDYQKAPHQCTSRLDLWSNAHIGLERHFREKQIPNVKDPRFLALLGTSINRISLFHSCLIRHLDQTQAKCADESKSELKRIRRFCIFHNDLIVSKVKHFFFREEPNLHENPNFLDPELQVYHLGEDLGYAIDNLAHHKDLETQYSNACRLFGKYFYLTELIYDFIYDENHQGLFLEFAYDKQRYLACRRVLEQFVTILSDEILRCNLDSNVTSKHWLFDVLKYRYSSRYLLISVLEACLGCPDDGVPKSLKKRFSILLNAYRSARTGGAAIEPMTWHLCTIIWKVYGYLNDAWRYHDFSNREAREISLIIHIKELILNHLAICDKAYRSNEIDYAEMFNNETNFISKLYYPFDRRPFIPFHSKTSIKECLHKLDGLFLDKVHLFPKRQERKVGPFEATLRKINSRVENQDNLKIEFLLDFLDRNELSDLLVAFIENQQFIESNKNDTIVGFLSSGVFLGHLANLYTDNLTRPVWAFKLYPYIAIQPFHRHNICGEGNSPTLVTFDESVKTGYSIGAFEAYVESSFPSGTNISVHTLCDFKRSYQRIHGLRSKIHSMLVENPRSHFVLNPDVHRVKESYVPLEWNSLVDAALMTNAINLITHKDHFDLSLLLSNTPFLLSLCRKFALDIENHVGNEKERRILLFSPSNEGRVLMFMTAFFLKLDGFTIGLTESSWKRFSASNPFKVSIDLSQTTGYVLASNWASFIDYPLVWESSGSRNSEVAVVGSTNRAEDYFDLVLKAWPNINKD
jgi:hypothetical protein